MSKVISWFSCGVSSAVATKLAIKKYGDIQIIYTHIDDQHEDTLRFLKECEKWFGIDIEIMQSEYKNVNDACLKAGFIASPYGAACTKRLKRDLRKQWEKENGTGYTYIWGYDLNEQHRADRIVDSMPEYKHEFPLIENYYDKRMVHGLLEDAGINRPMMYELGYPNNNCIGCLKGGMGYWNKIREDFPDVFESRCKLEETIGGRIFKDFMLRDLDKDRGNKLDIIVPDCGMFCEIYSVKDLLEKEGK